MGEVPPSTWGYYGTRSYELAQRKGHRVYDRRRFEEAAAVDGIRRLSGQAEEWWSLFVLTPARLADALIDQHIHPSIQRRQ